MSEAEQFSETTQALSVEAGMRIARRFFEKRGNHAEAHVGEVEFAGMTAIAWALGFEAGLAVPNRDGRIRK